VHRAVEAIQIDIDFDTDGEESPLCQATITYVPAEMGETTEREKQLRNFTKGAGNRKPFDDIDIKTAEER
jgi:hypothetical protein